MRPGDVCGRGYAAPTTVGSVGSSRTRRFNTVLKFSKLLWNSITLFDGNCAFIFGNLLFIVDCHVCTPANAQASIEDAQGA